MKLKNMLKRLTWNYRKDENSNIYKLFASFSPEIENLKSIFEQVEAWRGIKNAEGQTLDLIGEDIRQERQGMSDEKYRPMLRFRTAVNRSNTDINNINTAMKSITENGFVRLYEGYNHEPYKESASIVAELKRLYLGMPFREMENIIAAGVRLIWEVNKKEEMALYLAIHTRSFRHIKAKLDIVEEMKYETKLYLGTYNRQVKHIIAEMAIVEEIKQQQRLYAGVALRILKVIRERREESNG